MSDKASRALFLLGGGAAAWVGFRLYVRSELLNELLRSKVIEKMTATNTVAKALGLDLQLPTAQRLAETMVPIWSTIMPRQAVSDLLVHGRESKYWPSEYAQGGDLAIFEPILLSIGRDMTSPGA